MNPSEARQQIVRHVAAALEQALGALTGGEFKVKASENGAPPRESSPRDALTEPIYWQQTFSVVDSPSMWFGAGKDLWEAVARLTFESAGIDSPTDEDCRSTWQELLGQVAGSVATALTADFSHEVTSVRGEVIAAPASEPAWTIFVVTWGAGKASFSAAWTSDLEQCFDQRSHDPPDPDARHNNVSRTFDLLLEVALPVCVSFGRASLQIREVLKLNTGSIVELDRFAADPVDVVVNGCIIARGEVVVVDGNYGIRISQLASRADRLRTGMQEHSRHGASGAAA